MKLRLTLIILVLMLSGFAGFILSMRQHQPPRPNDVTGDIQMIETFHYPSLFVKQLRGDKDAGRKIFMQFCTSCHGNPPTIDINAPRVGDKAAWKIRERMGMPALMSITTMGVGAMPARGGCFECSDEQLKETIEYMLKVSR